MRHRCHRIVATCLTTGLCLVGPAAGAAGGDSSLLDVEPEVSDRRRHDVIVHLAAGADTGERLKRDPGPADQIRLKAVADATARASKELSASIPAADLSISRVFRLQPTIVASVSDDGLAALDDNPLVKWIEPDRRWEALTQEGLQLIGADILHGMGIAGEGTAVAILDTGVDYLHPTLGGGQIPNAKVVYGLDTADGDDDPMDCHGHGTAVASVAAGSSYQWSPNRRFSGGVAPAAKVLAYKITSDSGCRAAATSAVIAAVEDAVLRRSQPGYRLAAINISFGGGAFSGPCDSANLAYAEAIATANEAGIVVVAAAGNDGYQDSLNAPACVTHTLSVGSAWDVDPGALGYRFCLDPECRQSCDDSFRWQKAVACYSNSNAYLDLVAPSEFLKAAAVGGVTVDFGGTSGAAAYVTGAAALLAQAYAGINPTTTRFLLAATGQPTMDDKNGLIRPVIDLAAAVENAATVSVAQEAALPIDRRPAPPTTSGVFVDRTGVVGSVKVLMNLAHSNPENLRIILQSPDGTEVLLHDHGPGTTPASVGGMRFDGITGTYPDDLEPVQSLGLFAGRPLNGWWTLSIEDFGTGDGDQIPRLLGWALQAAGQSQPGVDEAVMVFPVVARAEGAHQTSWRSDLRIFNSSPNMESELRLFLVPPAGSDTVAIRQADATVPHRSSLALNDLVASRFGLDVGQGSLVVRDSTESSIHGTSRTYTTSSSGTYGQFIAPIVGGAQSTGSGEPPLVILPTAESDHRINIGFTEVTGRSATIAVTVIDGVTGTAMGQSAFYIIESFQNLQLNGALPDPGTHPGAEPYVTVTVVQGEGRIAAYASVIDNRTGDAVFVNGAIPEVTSFLLVPVVARVQGQAGTHWQSDVRVLNHGSFSVHVEAELRFHGAVGLPPVVETFELRPAEALTLTDVVGTFFGFDQTVGSLRLVPREGAAALVATSRTANHVADGTYGQYVPAIQAEGGLTQYGTLLHLEDSDKVRCNIGLVETDGKSVTVEFQLVGERGQPLGQLSQVHLGPWESVQINNIFGFLGVQPQDNVHLDLHRVSGAGRYSAYASVIDADSGDAIFVPILETAN